MKMKSQIQKVRVAISTGLGMPVEVEVLQEELERMTVEEALHFFIRKCNGQPTARMIRHILMSRAGYEVQINGKDADPVKDRVGDLLKDLGSEGPVEELNVKVTHRQSGG